MTTSSAPTEPWPATRQTPPRMADLDLSPQGLADAPANQGEPDSLVHSGNS
jgi:hypothetical protein